MREPFERDRENNAVGEIYAAGEFDVNEELRPNWYKQDSQGRWPNEKDWENVPADEMDKLLADWHSRIKREESDLELIIKASKEANTFFMDALKRNGII